VAFSASHSFRNRFGAVSRPLQISRARAQPRPAEHQKTARDNAMCIVQSG
jgi:hypothetical protein